MLEIVVRTSIDGVNEAEWNACAGGDSLLQHSFFRALERSGAIGATRPIRPLYVLLRDPQGGLLAGAPAMLRVGTLAEYGPEERWLKAGLAEGRFSWPKFQVGLPLYAVRGPRLLIRPGAPREPLRTVLLDALTRLAVERFQRSGTNLMHVEAELADRLSRDNWLLSHEYHSFWHNAGQKDFDGWLATLPHRKRSMIRNERRRVAGLGLDIRLLPGEAITPRLLDSYHAGHRQVCARYGNRPWLPPAALWHLVEEMPQAIRMIVALDGGRYVAGAFWIISGDGLVLRTWSAFRELPLLCFELICYRPIEYALANGLKYVDSGLTSLYKRHRRFVDEAVASAHWFADGRLRELAERELAATAARDESATRAGAGSYCPATAPSGRPRYPPRPRR